MTLALPLLAAFISPALFYGGAAAVAAPILIHLLARRRFKRIRWAAMDFLIDAERRNRRRIRMEEWILLLLRCLAVLFIALIVARPFIKPAGAAALWGGSQRTERVFVLDDSFSMAYQSPEGTPFTRAKSAVRRLLETIRKETPDDTVTVLRMSAPTAPVESGTYLDDAQTEELLGRLEALTPSQRSIDPVGVVEGVTEVLERNPDITSAAVYLISDFQRHAWVEREAAGEGDSAKASILTPLTAWANGDRGLHLVLVNVGDEMSANRAVTELSIRGGQLIAGTTGVVRAKVANFPPKDGPQAESVENLELELSVGHLPQPSKTLRELTAGQSVSVDLEAEFPRAGSNAVRVELPPDALPTDDVRYMAAEVADAIRVLIVNGEPSADSYDDEVTFLATALRPEGEVFSGNEIVVVDEAKLEEINLNNFHVAVLANVYRVSEPAIESLERFVQQGGGLVVFLGDQVDADLYNAALYRGGEGLLPAELTERVRAANESHLVVTDRLHPAMRGLSREGDPLGIGQVPFFEYFGCVPYESKMGLGGSGLGAAEGQPQTPNPVPQTPSRVIARFDDADEHPAIVESAKGGFGRGRVILVTTAADKEWHHWPDHPTFLPVVMELIRHVARQGGAGTEYWVGETIHLPLEPAVFEPDAVLRTPAYPNEREIGLTALPGSDGRGLVLRWEHTDVAGFYQFVLKRRESGETVKLAAVNVDPRESDLTMAEEDELRRAMGDVPFEYIKGIDRLTGIAGEARTELWRACLLATLAVLMVEQCLAWWWGRSKNTEPQKRRNFKTRERSTF